MGVVAVGGRDLLQGGQCLVVLPALGVVNQAQRVVGVEELGVGGEGGLQGGGGAVVLAERVVRNA